MPWATVVEVAGWVHAGELSARVGHPWLVSGRAFALRLRRLTGISVGATDALPSSH